ncbi:hypothetical protein Afil01_55160 [Actinorhabdospora filicis]|uniref:Uncharacterized protein n=1 Tax=Actinorhabdospora filicis TaxID=1785913 RepID=A0A9W6SRM2_9ACTN|nr:hypothetical protein [Actinorhabdospora filicis]GLZ80709.1 hypothetical protein Afil01_55160 [Actinorhabdospora filicis]
MTEPEPDAEPQELRKGGPKVFLLLTCGFLTLLCCLGTCLVGGALGLTRQENLAAARDGLGAPSGWRVAESTDWPWSASATLTGPDDPAAVSAWLSGLGEPGECPCEFKVGERTVSVTVDGGSLELSVS